MTVLRDKFLVDLEALFDFRLATITLLHGDKYSEVLFSDEQYEKRTSDIFTEIPGMEDFDQKAFDAEYAKHDWSKLRDFIIGTRMLSRLEEWCFVNTRVNPSQDYTPSPELTINVWPYKIPAEDLELLEEGMKANFISFDNVKLINLAPDFLPPEMIRLNYGDILLYDFQRWFLANQTKLTKVQIPSVQFTVPRKAIKKDVEGLFANGTTEFALRSLFAGTLQLNFENLDVFSANMEKMIENMAEEYQDGL